MIYTEYIKIASSVVHIIGNKTSDEGLFLSDNLLSLDENTNQILLKYLLSPFKSDDYYQMWHESDLSLNEVYTFACKIFEDRNTFLEMSKAFARHLYAHSNHPKIKRGELCIVYLKNVIVGTTTCDAVGIFKSENKDTFLQIKSEKGRVTMQSETGINVNRQDKGCIIFNTQKENGFIVSIVDTTNRQNEAKYWTDEFLKVRPLSNSYNQTEQLLTITKEFVSQMPDVDNKIQKVNYINRSVEAFSRSNVKLENYSHDVFQDELKERDFAEYTQKRASEIGITFDKEFEVSSQAVRKKKVGAMTTIRLDKNFDIHIHGGEQLIEQGFDNEKGMRYYKLYFIEEK